MKTVTIFSAVWTGFCARFVRYKVSVHDSEQLRYKDL